MSKNTINFALNHMSAPSLNYKALIQLAEELKCSGVEFRNDLSRPLFDGETPELVKQAVENAGLEILALAEIKRFNFIASSDRENDAQIIKTAAQSGAKAVSLIPSNDGTGCANGERQANLKAAIANLKPQLENHNLMGYIEPLGFASSSVRYKEEVVDILTQLNATSRFKIIHDTFHHHLASEKNFFPDHTGLVHISGVEDTELTVDQMQDEHRVLVGKGDRLENISQLKTLIQGGYSGAISYEAFAPSIHKLAEVSVDKSKAALQASMDYIEKEMAS